MSRFHVVVLLFGIIAICSSLIGCKDPSAIDSNNSSDQASDICEQFEGHDNDFEAALATIQNAYSSELKLCAVLSLSSADIPLKESIIDKLAYALANDDSGTVRFAIIDLLNKHPVEHNHLSENAKDNLLKAFSSSDRFVRSQLIEFLGKNKVDQELFLPVLIELLWDSDTSVQGNSALAIQQYTEQQFSSTANWGAFKLGDGGLPEITLTARAWAASQHE